MTLTKKEMIQQVQDKTGLNKKESIAALESVFEIIKDDLNKGNDVKISGFGKWTVKAKKARRGRNPRTGEEMMLDVRKVVLFRPSQTLRKKF